jgi:hypothetical protein
MKKIGARKIKKVWENFSILNFCEAKRRKWSCYISFFFILVASVPPNPTLAVTRDSHKEYQLTEFT